MALLPAWTTGKLYGYWDRLQKPDWWPEGAAWPPADPANGQLPPQPEGWSGPLNWNVALAQLGQAKRQADIAAGQEPSIPTATPTPEATPTATAPATPAGPPVALSAEFPQPILPSATPPAATTPAAATPTPAVAPSPVTPAATPAIPAAFAGEDVAHPVPPALSGSEIFKRDSERFGGASSIKAWSGPPDGALPANRLWTVVYKVPGDNESTITIQYQHSGVGFSGPLIATGTTMNIKSNAAADAVLKASQAEETRIHGQLIGSQLQGQDLKNAQDTLNELERQRNEANKKGRLTDKEVIDATNQTTHATAATESAAASTTNAETGRANTNLAYIQAVAQVLQQKGYSWNQALTLAQNWAIEQTKVDQSNTNLAVNAANAIYGGDREQRAQDVSLANNRLNASNTGFSDDLRQAMSLNETMKPGSDKAADALIGMMGMRYLLAKKYGGLDEIPREQVPAILKQLGLNTPIKLPSMMSPREIIDVAQAAQEAGGITGWPDTSKITPPFNSSAAPKPAVTSTPRTTSATPSTVARAEATGHNGSAGGNERDDDLLTVLDERTNQTSVISRSTWDGLGAEEQAYFRVLNAQAAPSRTQGVQPAQASGNERDDDVLTVQDQWGNRGQMTRAKWNENPTNRQGMVVVNAESAGSTLAQPAASESASGNERSDDILTVRHKESGQTEKITRQDWDTQVANRDEFDVVNAEADPRRFSHAPTAAPSDGDPQQVIRVRKTDGMIWQGPRYQAPEGETLEAATPERFDPVALADSTANQRAAEQTNALTYEDQQRKKKPWETYGLGPSWVEGLFA